MEKQAIEASKLLVSPEERAGLVRFCARITKRVDVAEDLAQETLLEAWRNIHKLRDFERRLAWLYGIARNVCLRWLHAHGREAAYLLALPQDEEHVLPDLEDRLVDDLDIEVTLERKELAELLDRALSLLPGETRMLLIQHYIEESPLAEIAAQWGTNASAAAMRLQRGKLHLRRVLTQEMGQELAPYTQHAVSDQWEVTPLWCHNCGQRRFLGQRDPAEGKLLLKCPLCNEGTGEVFNQSHLSELQGVRGYKPLYSRLTAWCNRYYRTALRDHTIACPGCGSALPVSINTPEQFPRWLKSRKEGQIWLRHPDERVLTIACERCTVSSITALEGLVLEGAEGQAFLKAHPRIRTLPRRYQEVDGRPAILSSFESVTDTARLHIISDEETYEVLCVYKDAL